MSQSGNREVEHEIIVLAPANVLYRLIADVENWPQLFPPTVHVECLDRHQSEERIQIWATANGEVKTWTSYRVLDPKTRRVDFRQEKSQPPVSAMSGTWAVEPLPEGKSRVRLRHEYRAIGNDPAKLDWIDKAVDHNSQSELAALKTSAEIAAGSSELLLTFGDTVQINGSAKDVFDFLNEAQLWSERLSHVVKVSLHEDPPGLQLLAMDTRTKDGSVHSTESVRVTFPHYKIVYKQTKMPPLMTLHTGHWLIEENSDGVAVTSRHTVVINETNVEKVLGEGAKVADARKFVHMALSENSLATLGYAKSYAEKPAEPGARNSQE